MRGRCKHKRFWKNRSHSMNAMKNQSLKMLVSLCLFLSNAARSGGLESMYERMTSAFFEWHGLSPPAPESIGFTEWLVPKTLSVSNLTFSVASVSNSFSVVTTQKEVAATGTFSLGDSPRTAWIAFGTQWSVNSLPPPDAFGRVQVVWSNETAVAFSPVSRTGEKRRIDPSEATLLCSNLTVTVRSHALPAADIAKSLFEQSESSSPEIGNE